MDVVCQTHIVASTFYRFILKLIAVIKSDILGKHLYLAHTSNRIWSLVCYVGSIVASTKHIEAVILQT